MDFYGWIEDQTMMFDTEICTWNVQEQNELSFSSWNALGFVRSNQGSHTVNKDERRRMDAIKKDDFVCELQNSLDMGKVK